jgi:hypothetical protein
VNDGAERLLWRLALVAAVALAVVLALLSLTAAFHSAASHRRIGSLSGATGLRQLRALPLQAQSVISSTLGAGQPAFQARATSSGYGIHGGGLEADLSRAGIRVSAGEQSLLIRLSAIGRGGRLPQVVATSPHAHANRVLYSHAGATEWYAAGPLGIEQGFTLAHRPAGSSQPVTLALGLEGALRGVRSGSRLDFWGPSGRLVLSYGGLSVSDARGRHLPAWLAFSGGRLLIRVADAGARYPLRIDPFIQQGEKLTGVSAGANLQFGWRVALSGDGSTMLIGGAADTSNRGAAWVFTRSGSTWAQQGEALTGSGGTGNGSFGYSVALSADGNTALIGAPTDDGVGAAWVFTRSGSQWTQQGSKLTGSGETGEGKFGRSVALSADGNTALIGGAYDYGLSGAAWVFTRSGSTWTQDGSKLIANDESASEESNFGWSVALSSDGNTALIGGWADNNYYGAAWVFTRSGSTWTQQGKKLTSGGGDRPWFGYSVALSADGNTALIGAPGEVRPTDINEFPGYGDLGSAWVFSRSGSTWTHQGEKLTAPLDGFAPELGYGVALSADGNTALIGAPSDNYSAGAAWVFKRSGSNWTREESKLKGVSTSNSASVFGFSVALSSDGNTGLIGGPFDNYSAGAAWVFAAAPQISSPPDLSFASQPVGRPSPVLWLEVKNTGDMPLASLTFSGAAQITGTDASDFAIPSGDDLCDGETLQPGQACRIGVQFTATTTGSRSATLSFATNNANPPAPTVALSGTGVGPTASFTIAPNPGTMGIPIEVNGTGSSDSDGSIKSYAWSFGDGTSGNSIAPSHTYTTPGSYPVTLTVTDNGGLTAKVTHPVTIKEAQLITFTSNAPSPATLGGSTYTVSATASSKLAVDFSSGTPSVCSLAGSTVSFLANGLCTINANQAGNPEYDAAPEARQSFTVDKRAQLITFTSNAPSPATVGGPIYAVGATSTSGLAVSLSSGTPSVCSLAGSTVSFLATGACTIDADQAGNSEYGAAAQAQQSFVVSAASMLLSTPPLTPALTPSVTLSLTAPSTPSVSPVPDSDFTLPAGPSINTNTGTITFSVPVSDPGTFRWLLTFQNGKFGDFSAGKTKCATGQIKLIGGCHPAKIVFGNGSTTVAPAGTVSFTVTPSASARTALKNALKKGQGLPVTATLIFQSSRGGARVSHTQTLTDTLKKTSKRGRM